jgi:hypothetical protein
MTTIQVQLEQPSDFRIVIITPETAYHDGVNHGWWPEIRIEVYDKDGKTVLHKAQLPMKGVTAPYDTQSEAYRAVLEFMSGEECECFIAILDALTTN